MIHEIKHGPSFALLRVTLEPGDRLVAEAGSMVSRDAHVHMDVKLNARRGAGVFALLGSLLIAVIRKLVGGETFFVNEFSAPQTGTVSLAPTFSGSVRHRKLAGERVLLSRGAFLACAGDIDVKMRWGGLRGLLAREGLFFLEVSGSGDVFFNSYGSIEEVQVAGRYVVDTGHIVGFDGAMDFRITTPGGGVLGFLGSGEGFVCEFQGNGRVYIQSRNVSALVGWISPHLPP